MQRRAQDSNLQGPFDAPVFKTGALPFGQPSRGLTWRRHRTTLNVGPGRPAPARPRRAPRPAPRDAGERRIDDDTRLDPHTDELRAVREPVVQSFTLPPLQPRDMAEIDSRCSFHLARQGDEARDPEPHRERRALCPTRTPCASC